MSWELVGQIAVLALIALVVIIGVGAIIYGIQERRK